MIIIAVVLIVHPRLFHEYKKREKEKAVSSHVLRELMNCTEVVCTSMNWVIVIATVQALHSGKSRFIYLFLQEHSKEHGAFQKKKMQENYGERDRHTDQPESVIYHIMYF